jgi:fatty acid desaturase
MSTAGYPESDRVILEQVVSDPRYRQIAALPTFAWQEILLIAGCYFTLLGSTFLYLHGALPYVATFAINALAIYAIFTPLHDAAHCSLSRSSLVNDALGTVAALPLFPGFTAGLYRYLHLQHHQHTGVEEDDPDEFMVSTPMPRRLLAMAFIDLYWIAWYLRRVSQRPRSEVIKAAASATFFVGWHVAWLTSPFAWQFVTLWLLPQRAGIMLLAYLFAFIQHPEGVRQTPRRRTTDRTALAGDAHDQGRWLDARPDAVTVPASDAPHVPDGAVLPLQQGLGRGAAPAA